jgi:hypothetical protein
MRGFVKADVRNERDLALACVGKVRTCGGVLEHPFASTLFDVCKLPKPGGGTDMYGGFTLKIFQGNFGHLVPKPTLLYICGCTPADIPEIPFQLIGETGRKFESLSANQRKATPPLFAEWLVSIARRCRRKGSVS